MEKLKYHISGLFLLLSLTMFAQQAHPLAEAVSRAKSLNNEYSEEITDILSPATNFRNTQASKEVRDASYFHYNVDVANKLIETTSDFISLQISSDENENIWTLDLIEVPESFYDYTVTTASGRPYEIDASYSRHYRGVIRGQEEESIVAISVYQNEIMGVISTLREGNFTLGKLENDQMHILYKDSDLLNPPAFYCDTPDDNKIKYDRTLLTNNVTTRSGADKCVRMYFETEYDMYQDKGSVANVVNYVTGLFNQVATIYYNENIVTKISEIKVWDVADPYTSTSIGNLLSQFQSAISSFNGDLGQLLTFRSIGGGMAAGFSGICNSNVDASLSVSGIHTSYASVPSYSWSVMVVTHEFGHLLGSRHTHACVWNGNNTAIDGCSGYTEGSCPLPGIPAQGGTIMSYCHLQNVGINFSLGFGPQPGNVIRNRVANGNCLECCSDNPDHLVITQDISGGNHLFEADKSITANNAISNAAAVTYKAGLETVHLLPGFEVKAGSSFYAFIGGCATGAVPMISNSDMMDVVTDYDSKLEGRLRHDKISEKLKVYPNPLVDNATIEYNITDDHTPVTIIIFNMVGEKVAMPVNNVEKAAGLHQVSFNGSELPAGIYYCNLLAGERIHTKKMILVK